jgi:hypothetical protein
MRTRPVLLAALLSLLPACGCDPVPANAVEDCRVTAVLPDAVQTDILFVIDDSLSMQEEQANLSANLGAFIDALAASPVQNDFRVGVTSTSVEGFTLTAQAYGGGPAAGDPYPDGALVAIQQDATGDGIPGDLTYDPVAYAATGGWGGSRILDKGSPTLVRDFKANVLLGLDGSGKEQPFRAARLALSDRLLDANAGFLRPGARLAVIFVTDEDDCSDSIDPRATSNAECHASSVKDADPPVLDPPGELAGFLLGPVDGELRDVAVGAIAGFNPNTLAPSCGDASICADTTCATAYDDGERFAALRAALGAARMRLGSICDASFRDSLTGFAEILMPSTLPLQGAPADWRLLAVRLRRAAGDMTSCAVAAEGTPEQATADAVYSPPRFGRPAQLTFQNGCTLSLGDRIDVSVVCAG